jgi:hypothetical protein
MKRTLPLLAALAVLSCLTSDLAAQAKRAMWVWSTHDIINEVNGARQALFDFCAEPPGSNDALTVAESSQPITVLYFYCHSYVNGDSTKKARLRDFLRDAHANGIEVEFLDGASDWATTGKSYALTYMDHALNFNAGGANDDERFDGIQYDVEPYLLVDWFTVATWNSFMDLLSKCQAKVDSVGGDLRFGAAIPRWYESNPGRSYLVDLINRVDYVAVMNYTDVAKNMINDAANEIKIADSLGKKVVLGSETLLIDPASVTFAQEGWGNMEARLYELQLAYKNNASFAGIAVHDYKSYSAISKYGVNGVDATAPYTTSYRHSWTANNGGISLSVIDVCGSTLSTSGTTTNSKVSLNGTLLSGSWSVSGNTFTFAPSSSIDAGGSIKVIYSPTDAANNVRRDTISFSVAAVPAAVSPANAANINATYTTIKWNHALNATQYRLEMSTSSTFSTLYLDTTISDTAFAVSSLSDSATYYWRVRSLGSLSSTKPSTARSFMTKAPTLADTSSGGSGGSKGKGNKKQLLAVELGEDGSVIDQLSLQAFPNPATVSTNLLIESGHSGNAEISIFDATGVNVAQISEYLDSGRNYVSLNVHTLPAGAYMIRVITGDEMVMQKFYISR